MGWPTELAKTFSALIEAAVAGARRVELCSPPPRTRSQTTIPTTTKRAIAAIRATTSARRWALPRLLLVAIAPRLAGRSACSDNCLHLPGGRAQPVLTPPGDSSFTRRDARQGFTRGKCGNGTSVDPDPRS